MRDTQQFQRRIERFAPAVGLSGTVAGMVYSFTRIARGSTYPAILEGVVVSLAVTSVILVIGSTWLWITCRHKNSGRS